MTLVTAEIKKSNIESYKQVFQENQLFKWNLPDKTGGQQ